MEKEAIKISCIVTLMILLLLFSVYVIVWAPLVPLMEKEKEMIDYCEKKLDYKMKCSLGDAICLMNCEELNLEYFKYDNGGFGSSECWCRINNETKQIW